jgi:hypothetical protein
MSTYSSDTPLFIQNLERLKVMLRHYFRKQVEYDDATPRQRNMMNFVFERGYRLNLFQRGHAEQAPGIDYVHHSPQRLLLYKRTDRRVWLQPQNNSKGLYRFTELQHGSHHRQRQFLTLCCKYKRKLQSGNGFFYA